MQSRIHLLVFTAAIIIGSISAGNIPYKDCGSTAKLNTVDMSDCTTLPCTFYKGKNYTFFLDFQAGADTPTASNKVYGIIAGVPVPFPLPQQDACSNGIACPVKANQRYNETMELAVLQEYPTVSLFVKFEVLDSNSNTMACVLFPAKVEDPSQSRLSKLKKLT